jgi:glycosyltransferase involved in cell wall biosynthesis
LAPRPLVVGIDGRELAGAPTGTGRYLRNLLRRWRDSGDTLIVYFNGRPPADPVLDHPSIRPRASSGSARGVVWQQRELPRLVREDRPDVFFSPAYSCPLVLRTPRVTAVHDLSFFGYPQDFQPLDGLRRRLLVALSLGVSRSLLVCSDFTRRELLGLFPQLGERVLHVPLGPDDDLPAPPRREDARARLGLGGPYVLTVGALLNRRCIPELLRATALLRRAQPGLALDIVGDNRTHPRLDLRALVASLSLEGCVRLSGYVDEAGLADRYAAADASVFLSEYEGFGLPALEAAARGVPLVTSRAPSLGEVFGGASLLVEPRDETAVARALDSILRDAALAGRLRAAGRRLASRYSWAETARRTRQALLEAAQPRLPGSRA